MFPRLISITQCVTCICCFHLTNFNIQHSKFLNFGFFKYTNISLKIEVGSVTKNNALTQIMFYFLSLIINHFTLIFNNTNLVLLKPNILLNCRYVCGSKDSENTFDRDVLLSPAWQY